MLVETESQRRRDPRFSLRSGYARIDVPAMQPEQAPLHAEVTEVSAAGIAFELERTMARPKTNTTLASVRIRVGRCLLEGDLLVKNVRDAGGSTITVGALFYPGNADCDNRLMGLLAGLAAGS